jgi:PAS domain S-box-containing protein
MHKNALPIAPVDLQAAIIRDPLTVTGDTPLMAAIATMNQSHNYCAHDLAAREAAWRQEARSSCVLVLEDERVVGIFTERDVVRHCAAQQDLTHWTIAQGMQSPVMTLPETEFTDVLVAINRLQQHQIRHLPLVDAAGRLSGLLTHESLRHTTRPVDLLRLRQVHEVMSPAVITAAPGVSMLTIAQILAQHQVSCVVIVATQGEGDAAIQRPVGMITERDVVRFRSLEVDLSHCNAATLMSQPVIEVQTGDSLWHVQTMMEEHQVRRVVVTDDRGELQGIITQSSLLNVLNPIELFHLAEMLEAKVKRLEAEKMTLLEQRASNLEHQVQARTTELSHKAEQDRILNAIALQIRSSLDLQTILDTAVAQIHQLLQCDRVTMWQMDDQYHTRVVAEATDSPDLLVGADIFDECFVESLTEPYREGKIHIVPDIETAAIAPCHRDLLRRIYTRAKVMVPLLCNDQLWGFLNVTERDFPRQWQPAEVELLQSLSVHLAIAIQQATTHAQLHQELHDRQQVEQRLNDAQKLAKVGSWEYDVQAGNLSWTAEVARIFERDPQDFNSAQGVFFEAVHPDDRALVRQAYDHHLREQQPYDIVHRLWMPDGRVKYVHEQCETDYAEDGTPLRSRGMVQDITDRKEVEIALATLNTELETRVQERTQQLREQDLQLQEFLENANDLIQSVRLADSHFEFVNQTWLNTLGYTAAEVENLTIFDVLHPDHHDSCRAMLDEIQAGDRCYLDRMELLFLTKDRREIVVEGSINCRYEGEYPVAARAIFRDITHQKNILEALRDSQKRYQRLVDDIGSKFLIFSHTGKLGRLTYVSSGCEAIFGQDRADLLGQPWLEAVQWLPESHAQSHAILNDFFQHPQQSQPQQCELQFRHPDGQIRTIALHQHPVRDEAGTLIAVEGIAENITAQKAAAIHLQNLNYRLQIALRSVAMGIWDWNIQAQHLTWDDRMFEIYGIQADDFTGQVEYWRDILHPDDREATLAKIQQALTGVCEFVDQFRIVQPTGEVRWIDAHSLIQRDAQGKITHMVGTNLDVTERITAEQERQTLLQELTNFKSAIDQAAIVVITDTDGTILYANDRFCERSGYTLAEVIGQTHRLVKSGYHPPEFFGELWETIRQGRVWRGEVCNRTKTGEPYWMDTTVVPFLDDQGAPVQYLAIRFDITARKAAEVEIQRQLAAIEAAIDGIGVLQGDTYIAVNDAHLTLFGFTESSELIGQSWHMLYEASEIRRFEREVFPVLGRDRAWKGEAIAKRTDGSTFVEELSLTLTAENLLICVCRDVTERKQAERIVRQQAQKDHLLASITQQMRSSLSLADVLNTTVQEVHQVLQCSRVLVYRVFPWGNGAAIAESALPGWSRLLDREFPEEVFPKENYDRYVQGRVFALHDRDAQPQQVLPCLVEFLTEIQVRAKLVVPIVQQDSLWGLIIAHQCDRPRAWQTWEIDLLRKIGDQLAIAIQQADLFEQVQAELLERQQAEQKLTERNQELALSNQKLERATRLKDEFLANMSHELRTPLNAILGMTEGLQDQVFGAIAPAQTKALHTIEQSGTHLLSLINDILDLSKIEAGQVHLDCSPTAIAPLCRQSLSFIKQQAYNKKITLKTQIPAHIPRVTLDERRIRQVLINLLNNAVKFTPDGGRITLTVTLVTATDHHHESMMKLAIQDTGIGIAKDDLSRLFQPFIQIDSALNRQYSGTGLGLALVRRIVELHGGYVEVVSEVNQGSCFMIYLPGLVTGTEETMAQLNSSAPGSADSPTHSSQPIVTPLILLAEDNEANVLTLSGYLEAKGYQLIFAKTGTEAIAIAQAEQPDIILMDIQMPGMDGLEAIQTIRQDATIATIPIIALTALAMTGDRDRCLAAGANAYLSKPVKLRNLIIMIQDLLKS